MNELIVYKLDERGGHVWDYPAVELQRGAHFVRLEAYFNRDDLDLGFAIFARGDRFIEYFYNDRWYNVFAVHNGRGQVLKGWYCNVCRPASLGKTEIRCEDLALDVWVPLAGEPLVLDEDEFADLAITDGDREQSLAALGELLRMARTGDMPR